MSTTALSPESLKLTALLDEALDVFFKQNPIEGGLLDYPKYRDEIFDMTNQDQFVSDFNRISGELDALDQSALCEQERDLIVLTKCIIHSSVLETRLYTRKDMPCSHMIGTIASLWMMMDHLSPFKTGKDIENFRSRLLKISPRMDQVIDGFRLGIKSGITLPARSIDLIIESCDAYAGEDPAENPWNLSKQALAAGHPEDYFIDAIRTSVIPAHNKFKAFLRDEYRAHARKNDGLHGIPGSADIYASYIEYNTDSKVSAEELHATGVKLVARIAKEMEDTIAKIGFKGTIKEFNAELSNKETYPQLYIDSTAEVIPRYQEIVEIINAKMPQFFSKFPKQKCLIEAVPPHMQGNAPEAMYFPGTKEKPGRFMINLRLYENRPTCGMRALTVHEAVPGHHHQVSLALEREVPHDICKIVHSTAWSEGWGLYCETLGSEMGMYEDPFHYYGRLQLEIHRAVRLVVDTGLHAYGWSIEKVKETMAAYLPISDAALESEAVRYASLPGQALAYKVGEIRLHEMRKLATDKLGNAFDVREFHDLLMSQGDAPLPYFQTKVEKWIAQKMEA
ncbi:hypothetical protein HDU87_000211 [Geranomyces variabilis]|uniref:DUF885 domain-containing protein n=1 Tax=Geranomyces variabilis TaxID=109894 RepID=A0AAD5TUD2_9FUNG|nr:hypothetical protein HDU87_000211 [Geranomyces variabilis]